MALAITPQGEFGDLPNFGKASNREARPWLDSVLTADYFTYWHLEAAKKRTDRKIYQFHFNCYPWCA